jgi:hypothetical protein
MRRGALILFLLVGCSSAGGRRDRDGDVTVPPDGGGQPGDGPGREGGAIPNEESILGRPSRGTYRCQIQRGHTDHSPRNWGFVTPALVAAGGAAYLARVEGMTQSFFNPSDGKLLLSSLAGDGTFGPPVALSAVVPADVGSIAAAPAGEGFALVWVNGTRLRFAAFDSGGQPTTEPRDVLGDPKGLIEPAIATGPDGGFGVAYAVQTAGNGRQVRFTVLDRDGTPRLPPRPLSTAPGLPFLNPGTAVAASRDGYAIIWRDPAAKTADLQFAAADASGKEMTAAHPIWTGPDPGVQQPGAGFFYEQVDTALIRAGDGYVAAWTENHPSPTLEDTIANRGAYSVVRLARLDGSGALVGRPLALRAPAESFDEVEPTLMPYGEAIAVLWSRGSHIYVCGGCVPDDRIDFVLVDPATLTPLSEVVSITNGGPLGLRPIDAGSGGNVSGGLLRHRAAVLGDSVLLTYLITFHTSTKPGSALIRCQH